MQIPKLVIFDCDGVLVDTERPSNEVLVKNLAARGLHLTLEECMDLFVGGTMADVGRKARDLGADIPDDWTDEIYAQMYERLRAGIDPIPGIAEVLDQLDAAEIPFCVGSNGSPEKMGITLGQTGLLDRFERAMFSPHVIGMDKAKPNAGLFLHAAAQMGVDPADAVVIEDSVNGARGAKSAGIRCFGYAVDSDADALRAEGATAFFAMDELPVLLGL